MVTKAQVIANYLAKNPRIVVKPESWLMRFLGRFINSFDSFVTTLRFPWCRAVIYCPPAVDILNRHWMILDHELCHVAQFEPWYGPAKMAAKYATKRGRWHVERVAYLRDIDNGRLTPEQAVDVLCRGYYLETLRAEMVAWFDEHKHKGERAIW